MRIRRIALMLALLALPLSRASADDPPKGFTAVFDGNLLT